MQAMGQNVYARRSILLGTAAAGILLALPGCAGTGGLGGAPSLVDVVRRLLEHATRHAFATLTAPDGFWNSAVSRIELPVLFGRPGSALQGVLASAAFRDQLQHKLNNVAEAGAKRAAPVVADAVRSMSVADAVSIIKGGPTSATSLLRQQMGAELVNAMIPALDDALRVANDPLIGQALKLLTGVDLNQVGHAVALNADSAIWYEIGNAETEVRRNPEKTNDPVLIAALKGASLL
jgi:hypothetical protein